MDFNKLVYKRESVRKYTDQKIDRDDLELCVRAGQLAPSACNSQPWTFVIVDDESLVQQVAQATFNPVIKFNKFTPGAVAFVVVVMEKTNISSWAGSITSNLEYNFIDLGIATQSLCLQAADIGVGTCMLGYFDQKKIKKLLDIEKGKRVGLVVAMGYSQHEDSRQKQRKAFDETCKYNSYK